MSGPIFSPKILKSIIRWSDGRTRRALAQTSWALFALVFDVERRRDWLEIVDWRGYGRHFVLLIAGIPALELKRYKWGNCLISSPILGIQLYVGPGPVILKYRDIRGRCEVVPDNAVKVSGPGLRPEDMPEMYEYVQNIDINTFVRESAPGGLSIFIDGARACRFPGGFHPFRAYFHDIYGAEIRLRAPPDMMRRTNWYDYILHRFAKTRLSPDKWIK